MHILIHSFVFAKLVCVCVCVCVCVSWNVLACTLVWLRQLPEVLAVCILTVIKTSPSVNVTVCAETWE